MIRWRVVCAFDVMIDNFSTDQCVHECRFADVGVSDDIYKARFVQFPLGYDPDKR